MVGNALSLWFAMGIAAKLVVLGLLAMTGAIPVLAVATLRRARPEPSGRALVAVAASAPMLGLLGTVLGAINSLMYMAGPGFVEVTQIAAGLAEALVTTALGLLIGVAALWVRTAVLACVQLRERSRLREAALAREEVAESR